MRGKLAEVAPEEQLGELLRELGEGLELLDAGLPPLGVVRAERRSDELVQQPRLAIGSCPEGAQMARGQPVARELGAGDRDLHVPGLVVPLAPFPPRLEQAELLQLAGELGRDRRPLAQLAEVELVLGLGDPPRAPAPALLARPRRRCELLPDHAQGQELVALEPEDGLEPLDVVLAEEPVAALRPPRREQALVLEVPDLRDRDVRELGLETPADGADREQPPLRLPVCRGRRAHFSRKVSLYLPIWSSSPFSSLPDSIRFRFRKVPLRLPWSSMKNSPSRRISTACFRETVTSSRKMSQSGERPIVILSPCGTKCSPARPPPERTTSAGPSAPSSSSVGVASSPTSSGV